MLSSFRRQMADYARGERLKALRNERHLSQEDAAYEIGVSVKTLRSWEKGHGIKWANAKSVGEFFDVDPETLVTRNGSEALDPLPHEQLDRIEEKLDRVLLTVEPDAALQAATDASRQRPPSRHRSAQARASKPRKRAAS